MVLCADLADCQVITEAVQSCMLEAVNCSSLEEAQQLMARSDIALVLCDDRLRAGTCRELLAMPPRAGRKVPIVVIMPEPVGDDAYREDIGQGAFEVLASPCSRQDVQWVVIRAMEQKLPPRSAQRA